MFVDIVCHDFIRSKPHFLRMTLMLSHSFIIFIYMHRFFLYNQHIANCSFEGMSDLVKSAIVVHVFSGWPERKDIDCPSVQLWLCSHFIIIKHEVRQSAHKHLARIWKCIIALVGQFDLQNKDAHLLYNTIFKDNSPKKYYVLTLL